MVRRWVNLGQWVKKLDKFIQTRPYSHKIHSFNAQFPNQAHMGNNLTNFLNYSRYYPWLIVQPQAAYYINAKHVSISGYVPPGGAPGGGAPPNPPPSQYYMMQQAQQEALSYWVA